jgi:hypothetical protein
MRVQTGIGIGIGIAITLQLPAPGWATQPKVRLAPAAARVALAHEVVAGAPAPPSQIAALMAAGQKLEDARDWAGAEKEYRQALALAQRLLGPDAPTVAEIDTRLANVLRATGKSAEAEMLLRSALSITEQAFGTGHLKTAAGLDALHTVLAERGNWAAARGVAARSLEIKKIQLGQQNVQTVAAAVNLDRAVEAGKRTTSAAGATAPHRLVRIRPTPSAAGAPEEAANVAPAPESAADAGPDYDALDKALARLRQASIAYDVPQEMDIDDTRVLRLLISLAATVDDLKKALNDGQPGGVDGATVKVSPVMEAHLSGPGFKIAADTNEEQPVGAQATTEWRWQIAPQQSGEQLLALVLNARVSIDGSNTEYMIRSWDKTIKVRVTAWSRVRGFVSEHVEWLWGLIIAPVGGFVWTKLRSASRRQAKAARPGTLG